MLFSLTFLFYDPDNQLPLQLNYILSHVCVSLCGKKLNWVINLLRQERMCSGVKKPWCKVTRTFFCYMHNQQTCPRVFTPWPVTGPVWLLWGTFPVNGSFGQYCKCWALYKLDKILLQETMTKGKLLSMLDPVINNVVSRDHWTLRVIW